MRSETKTGAPTASLPIGRAGRLGTRRLARGLLTTGRAGRRAAGLVVLLLGISGCATDNPRFDARGEINGHVISTTVDAVEAKYYLESYLTGSNRDPVFESGIDRALARVSPSRIEDDEFGDLAGASSRDLATLHLIKRLSEIPENGRMQRAYWEAVEALRDLFDGTDALPGRCTIGSPRVVLLFVPGWLYRTNSHTGSDFAEQRRILGDLGFQTHLIATEENGSVEVNARIVADRLREIGQGPAPIVVISASKAGPEVAHALGHLLTSEETAAVKAWINVGGLLKGSPLADWGTNWPNSLLVRFYFALKSLDISESLASMTTRRSRDRWQRQSIPAHIELVNFVAVPLSGHITANARFGYSRTGRSGPTDGLTSIIDELSHGGVTVIEVGLDHYYKDPEIHLKTLALAFTVVRGSVGPIEVDCPAPAVPLDEAAAARAPLYFQ